MLICSVSDKRSSLEIESEEIVLFQSPNQVHSEQLPCSSATQSAYPIPIRKTPRPDNTSL